MSKAIYRFFSFFLLLTALTGCPYRIVNEINSYKHIEASNQGFSITTHPRVMVYPIVVVKDSPIVMYDRVTISGYKNIGDVVVETVNFELEQRGYQTLDYFPDFLEINRVIPRTIEEVQANGELKTFLIENKWNALVCVKVNLWGGSKLSNSDLDMEVYVLDPSLNPIAHAHADVSHPPSNYAKQKVVSEVMGDILVKWNQELKRKA